MKTASPMQRLVRATIDPDTAVGAEAVSLDVDEVTQAKLAFSYNSVFEVVQTLAPGQVAEGVKFQLNPSPVYCMRIWASNGAETIRIIGADADVTDQNTILVRGAKLGYVGEVQGDFFFPSSDWFKFRMVSNSAKVEWTGRAMDVNGKAYIARANQLSEIAEFQPAQVADSVAVNMDQAWSMATQHSNPTYDWSFVDPNDDDEARGPEEVDAEVTETYVSWVKGFSTNKKTTDGQQKYFDNIANDWNIYASNSANKQRWIDEFKMWADALNSRYGLYDPTFTDVTSPGWTSHNTISVQTIVKPSKTAQADPLGAIFQKWSETPALIGTQESDTTEAMSNWYDTQIASGNASALNLSNSANYPWPPSLLAQSPDHTVDRRIVIELKWRPKLRASARQMATRVPIPRRMGFGANVLEPTNFFVDKHVKSPIAEITSDNLRVAVKVNVMLELVTDDKSPFGELIKKKPELGVLTPYMAEFNDVMEGLPPAIVLSDQGVGAQSVGSMESRGILSTICSLLGAPAAGLAEMVLPGSGDIVSGLAGAMATLNI